MGIFGDKRLDVVTEGDPADWGFDPFGGDIVDGKIRGRGTADMKGGVAAIMFAAQAIQQAGPFPGTIILAILAWGAYEWNGRSNAHGLVDRLISARTQDVPAIVEEIGPYRRWAGPMLAGVQSSHRESSIQHLHAAMARLPVDCRQQDFRIQIFGNFMFKIQPLYTCGCENKGVIIFGFQLFEPCIEIAA